MKKFLLFTLLISSIFYYNLSAVSVSLGFLGQFGMSGAIADSASKLPSSFRDFDMGYSFLVGMRNDITHNTGISILLDIGYYHDSYALKYDINGNRATENYQFDSFMIGGVFKFHFFFMSLSGGGGVKIPIGGTYRLEDSSLEYAHNRRYYLDRGDISDIFENALIPYVKFSLDFHILNYLLIGVYVNYDFALNFNNNGYLSDIRIANKSISSLDLGLQFGYFFNVLGNR
ncbi:hypothetical protein [Brachyspira pilosicoli]|uniref:Serpentine_recp domain containing protein n=1 Tax=Brachyspira pilosicoli TaxID=52584 RepID=A0A5C8FA46_BRAPL|nr:hypothetical protein [Brachyspira pilosicoli]TXJ46294.1 hypothetical protein EPJ72_02235 [Brachyspira pilosicoli]